VQFVDIRGDDDALRVLPRPVPDAVTGTHRRLPVCRLSAEISMPRVTARPCALRKPLADLVRARQPAEVGALAEPTLVTKNVILACCASAAPPAATSTAIARKTIEGLLFTSSSGNFGATHQVRCRKAIPLGEDLHDPTAVTNPPIGFVAQQTARRRPCEIGCFLQCEFGFGAGEPLLDDAPKAIPFTAAVCESTLRRSPERLEMDISHAGFFNGCGELPL
jgi:hypothetical protein